MTNAQTEAQAIARCVRGCATDDQYIELVERIATALAAKDARISELDHIVNHWLAEHDKLRAKLAEANKALDALGTPPSPIQRLGAAVSRRDWHEAEQAHEIIRDIIDAARHAREQGGE